MRLVGTLKSENDAKRICHFLKLQEIANSCEVGFEPRTGQMSYQLWIHDEDRIEEAFKIFEDFLKDPKASKYKEPEPEPLPVSEKVSLPSRFRFHLTFLIIAISVFVFFIHTMQQVALQKKGFLKQSLLLTPIQALLMFDLPPAFETLEGLLEDDSPEEVGKAVLTATQSSYWKGMYAWVVAKINNTSTLPGEGPLFLKIRQGEVWRLISPCILHKDLLHILFNMLWLWYLGRPIEARIGPFRTLLLSLIAGAGTNILQYLMSGPFFIGYSGVITALAGFSWMRERIAPWEGYPLTKGTLYFLLVFILAIFGIQAVAFFIQTFSHYDFTPNIANTAHISGAVIGILCGRLKCFAQKVRP